MPVVKKAVKGMAKIMDKLIPFTKKESGFLKSLLQRRFLSFGVEPTNACNANCPFCAYRFSDKLKKIMPLDLYRKVIEQYSALGGGGMALTPTVGDPLMDKTIIEKIKIACSYPNIKSIFFYTNLLNLEAFDIKEILLSGITRISVSTTIGSREMYLRLFGVDKYDVMFRNLIKLLEGNKRLNYPVDIILALRFDKTFDLDNNEDYKKILNLIDRKKITQIPNERGYDNWGGIINEKDLPKDAVFRQSIKERIEPCTELYRRMNILANGDVNFCVCRDYNYELTIGDVNKDSLDDIWKGERIKKLREDWEKGHIPTICRDCSNYAPISEFLKKSRMSLWSLWQRAK